MLKLSEAEIIDRIASGELFECEIEDGSFLLKVESYTPTICTAIHAGHRFRSKLLEVCALDESERLYEEDPYTDQLIQAMPITLIAQDSRYEYDLNRPISSCVYSTAWGRKVWKRKLSNKDRSESIRKHQAFYRVLDALISVVEQRFGAALVFDVHSYNFLRQESVSPTFNLGTEQIDKERWKSVIDFVLSKLSKVELPNLPVDSMENTVFYGRGYLIAHVNSRFQNSLVLPLEVKKVFMDELNGELYPLVMQSLSQQFKSCLAETSAFFARRFTSKRRTKKSDMLTERMDPSIVKVDRALHRLARGLETLFYINPINIPAESKQFFKSKGRYHPNFRYRQLDIDPYLFREKLYRLPVDSIRDPSIQSLYRDVIDGLSEKIDLLVKAGQPDFLYESLKYYGEPSLVDEQNARFLLHAGGFESDNADCVTTDELLSRFKHFSAEWGMTCKVETSAKLVASAMVSNSRKAVLIAKNLQLSNTEAQSLVHHELGVHMATTLNASAQRLKVFSLGLPGNTLTQEGLAILNEYQSGNMTLTRLRGLALRVLAVKEMLKYSDFRHTYAYLFEEHKLSQEDAFKLSVRVHRGGGFTKDYLYLNGVSLALEAIKNKDIRNLYVGKTGFAYLPLINEMVERQLVSAPKFYPEFLSNPVSNSPVLDYLMSCIRPSEPGVLKAYDRSGGIAA
ncbi:flavohemoglobin expression-modulating QEGLA motif protein [Pseudoteredinibacter isoporae]|uniref:flavohemoglobin expression-modulating QEGLA motif protein n=1 Tax=Pseudoteredinibacter isoporae TaxID=570281 RepID=UPI003101E209